MNLRFGLELWVYCGAAYRPWDTLPEADVAWLFEIIRPWLRRSLFDFSLFCFILDMRRNLLLLSLFEMVPWFENYY